MAKKQKQKVKKTEPKKVVEKKSSLFERLESWMDKRHHLIALVITAIALVLSFLMFNAKISTGLDDSTYIEQGYKYSKDFFNHFFTSQAPFYAMVLAFPIAIWGINIVLLKVITVMFFVASVYLLYRAFRFKVSWLVLFPALFIYATNSEALKYASLTYAEALYLFLQALFLVFLIKLISEANNSDDVKTIIKKNLKMIILSSVVFYFLFFTRTVGLAAILAVGALYLIRKEYKLMLIIPSFFAASYVLFEFIKNRIWSNVDQFSTQSKILFQKDAYDASLGNEDFNGFLTRAFENTKQYFAGRFYEILGIRDFPTMWQEDGGLMFITVLPIFIALYIAAKRKNKMMLFNVLFLGAICGFTFFALQTSWGQARYIMIVLPFIFMTWWWLIQHWFSFERTRPYQIFALIFMGIFIWQNLSYTSSLANKNIPIAKANLLQGDKYMGYTPDWVNFLRMSEWCGKNLPDSTLVASRKAPMSFLYADGKKFYPIWRTTPNPDPDSTLQAFKEAGVTHVIVGTLRVNPLVSGQGFINTVHRILSPIERKYPQALEFVRQEGKTEDAKLFKINYVQ
ncbi:hypothetical protein GYB22_07015 [bacterium]|nr:hypothetical protein [bacterium]